MGLEFAAADEVINTLQAGIGDQKAGLVETDRWKRADGRMLNAATYPDLAALNLVRPNTVSAKDSIFAPALNNMTAFKPAIIKHNGKTIPSVVYSSTANYQAIGTTTHYNRSFGVTEDNEIYGAIPPYAFASNSSQSYALYGSGIATLGGKTFIAGEVYIHRASSPAFGNPGVLSMNTADGSAANFQSYAALNATGTGGFNGVSIAAIGNRLLVAANTAAANAIAYSDDLGANWSLHAVNNTNLSISGMATFAGRVYCARNVSVNTLSYLTEFGAVMSTVAMPSTTYWNRVKVVNDKLLAWYYQSASFVSSTDGNNFTPGTIPAGQICDFDYVGGLYVALMYNVDGGTAYYTSPDLVTWTKRYFPGCFSPNGGHNRSACNGTTLAVPISEASTSITRSPMVAYTTNGIDWAISIVSQAPATGTVSISCSTVYYNRLMCDGKNFFLISGGAAFADTIYVSADCEYWGFQPTGSDSYSSNPMGIFSHKSDWSMFASYSSGGGNRAAPSLCENGVMPYILSGGGNVVTASYGGQTLVLRNGIIYSTTDGKTFTPKWVLPYSVDHMQVFEGKLVAWSTKRTSHNQLWWHDSANGKWAIVPGYAPGTDGTLFGVVQGEPGYIVFVGSTKTGRIALSTMALSGTSYTSSYTGAGYVGGKYVFVNGSGSISAAATWGAAASGIGTAPGTGITDAYILTASGKAFIFANAATTGVIYATSDGATIGSITPSNGLVANVTATSVAYAGAQSYNWNFLVHEGLLYMSPYPASGSTGQLYVYDPAAPTVIRTYSPTASSMNYPTATGIVSGYIPTSDGVIVHYETAAHTGLPARFYSSSRNLEFDKWTLHQIGATQSDHYGLKGGSVLRLISNVAYTAKDPVGGFAIASRIYCLDDIWNPTMSPRTDAARIQSSSAYFTVADRVVRYQGQRAEIALNGITMSSIQVPFSPSTAPVWTAAGLLVMSQNSSSANDAPLCVVQLSTDGLAFSTVLALSDSGYSLRVSADGMAVIAYTSDYLSPWYGSLDGGLTWAEMPSLSGGVYGGTGLELFKLAAGGGGMRLCSTTPPSGTDKGGDILLTHDATKTRLPLRDFNTLIKVKP